MKILVDTPILLPSRKKLLVHPTLAVHPIMKSLDLLAGAYLAGVQGVRTPALFRYSPNCALKFLNQFKRYALKNQSKKRKNPSKRCTNNIILKFFNATLRSRLKRGSNQ